MISYHSLEAGMKVNQEGRFSRQSQNSLLNHGALHIIVLDDDVLLQNFDCVQLLSALSLGQHHLPEGSLAKNHQVIKILSPDDVLPFHIMRNHGVLLDYFALVV